MAKAVRAASRADGTWYVAEIFPNGTNMQNVANPPTGQLLLRWRQGYEPSINDNLDAETICSGLATVVGSATTINWTSVKQAIN